MQPRNSTTRLRVIAGRPVTEKPRNPWADADSDERLLAAAFANRVVLYTCIVIGVLLLAELAAPDFVAWISGAPAVMVMR